MVLRPIFDPVPVPAPGFIAAWSAVEQQQTAPARAWWLITQPDHAALSGEIARHFSGTGFPAVSQQIVQAIALHDAGWNLFEADAKTAPPVHPDGRPISFFEVEPRDFLRAWIASIDRAAEESDVGGYLVSQHFVWLGEYRLQRVADLPPVQRLMEAFLASETDRQAGLRASHHSAGWDTLLPVLQFCDLFSLYLCSGSRQAVEFPQEFSAGRIRAHFEGDICTLSPTPFARPWTATVEARRYPGASDNLRSSVPISAR